MSPLNKQFSTYCLNKYCIGSVGFYICCLYEQHIRRELLQVSGIPKYILFSLERPITILVLHSQHIDTMLSVMFYYIL